jgi:hypothetical protein
MVRLPHNPSLAPLASRGRGGSQDCSARAVRELLRRRPVTWYSPTSPVWQDSRGRLSLPPGWQVRGRAPSARCAWAEATCRACRTRLPESKVTRYPPLATVRAHLWATPAGLVVRAARAGRFQKYDGDLTLPGSSWTSGAACRGNASCTLGRILTTNTRTRFVVSCSVPARRCSACPEVLPAGDALVRTCADGCRILLACGVKVTIQSFFFRW